jgi:hypothetical protein
LQGCRTWLQHLCVTLACTRCSSASFSASCDAIQIGLPLPRAECFCSILADALVQFIPDFRLRLAVPHSPLLPPREPKPAHTGAISISSASSPQCCLISFAAFPLTVSDILHARLYYSLGGSACSRRITTPLASRATSLYIIALHAVQLLLRFQLSNPCSPGLAASLPRSHTRVRATWADSCPSRATRACAPTVPPAPSARAPLNTCTRHRLPLRYRAHVRASRPALLTFAPALPAVSLMSLRHTRTLPACWARARLLLSRAASTSCATCAFTRPCARARSRALPRLLRTLRAPAVVHARATSPAPARAPHQRHA